MSKGIPTVKQWVVIGERDWKWLVWAPTKLLAILNFRRDVGYYAIKSIRLAKQH